MNRQEGVNILCDCPGAPENQILISMSLIWRKTGNIRQNMSKMAAELPGNVLRTNSGVKVTNTQVVVAKLDS